MLSFQRAVKSTLINGLARCFVTAKSPITGVFPPVVHNMEIVANNVLKHIGDNYNFEPVQPSHLINEFGYSIPLKGRDELMSVAKHLYDTRWENNNTRDRVCHKVGIIGGCSGIGKSRGLIEIANSIKNWKNADQWSFEIVISYNNGNPPEIDRRLFGRELRKRSAATALALRILYFSFVAGKSFGVSFESFATSFPKDLLDVLTPEIVIQAISAHMSIKHGHSNGVLFIGLDEANYLLEGDYTGEEEKRGFLKETLIALGNAMLLPTKFVFVIIAATTVLPINIVFHQTGLQFQPLPIKLLRLQECEKIIDEMGLLSEWRTCRAFRTLLADFAPMPRKAEELMKHVKHYINKDTTVADIDYQMVYNLLMGNICPLDKLADVAERIVSDILLATPIERERAIDGNKSPLTYGELEARGVVALATSADTCLTVQMPFSLFRKLVQLLDGNDPLTKSLRRICNLVSTESEFGTLSWQTFEELHCHVEASREMLMARQRDEMPSSTIGEFYCLQGEDAPENDFEFKLRRKCKVVTAASRFPSSTWTIVDGDLGKKDTEGNQLDAMTTYVKNAPGAAFDSFTLRELLDEGTRSMLFCGQQKLYVKTALSAEMVRTEAAKVKASLPEETLVTLVVTATKTATDASKNLPENCFVVTGPALIKFYSVFSARVNLFSDESLTHINVNTSSIHELMTIDKVGKATAQAIVKKKNDGGHFSSWKELNERVPLTKKCNEESFSY